MRLRNRKDPVACGATHVAPIVAHRLLARMGSVGLAMPPDDALDIRDEVAFFQTVRAALVRNTPAVLDIIQSGEADAFVRLYDAAGNLLRENDELTMDDNADGIFDAGWTGLSLDAGTHVIEAATFTDTGAGSFTVSVSEAN